MFKFLMCGLILFISSDAECTSAYKRIPSGWLAAHRGIVTWHDAVERCRNEGAMLASPFNDELLDAMVSAVTASVDTTPYFIGVHSLFHPDRFVSLEGVPLDDMPAASSSDVLDWSRGRCMSIDANGLHVVPCEDNLPYMCYKKDSGDQHLNECGTFDNEYKLVPSTGSCYKVHLDEKNWTEAYSQCLDEGAYLLVLNDKSEEKAVRKLVFEQPNFNFALIGVRQLVLGGPWVTVHWDSKEDYVFYKQYSPDKVDSNHVHVALLGKDDTWGYDPEDIIKPFICKKNPRYIRFPLDNKATKTVVNI